MCLACGSWGWKSLLFFPEEHLLTSSGAMLCLTCLPTMFVVQYFFFSKKICNAGRCQQPRFSKNYSFILLALETAHIHMLCGLGSFETLHLPDCISESGLWFLPTDEGTSSLLASPDIALPCFLGCLVDGAWYQFVFDLSSTKRWSPQQIHLLPDETKNL